HELRRQSWQSIVLSLRVAVFDRQVAPLDIAGFGENLTKQRLQVRKRSGETRAEITDHRRRLLRPRRQWPRRRRAAEQRDELAALHLRDHSITSSARASSVGGTVRPSARAVIRFMTKSNLIDCTTGRSAGLVPFRMRPT